MRTPKTDPSAVGKGKLWKRQKPILVVRRIFHSSGVYTHTIVSIESWVLRDALLEINAGVDGLSLKKSTPEVSPGYG